jgi:hypothetical protein
MGMGLEREGMREKICMIDLGEVNVLVVYTRSINDAWVLDWWIEVSVSGVGPCICI